jgi:hypothetical protein
LRSQLEIDALAGGTPYSFYHNTVIILSKSFFFTFTLRPAVVRTGATARGRFIVSRETMNQRARFPSSTTRFGPLK